MSWLQLGMMCPVGDCLLCDDTCCMFTAGLLYLLEIDFLVTEVITPSQSQFSLVKPDLCCRGGTLLPPYFDFEERALDLALFPGLHHFHACNRKWLEPFFHACNRKQCVPGSEATIDFQHIIVHTLTACFLDMEAESSSRSVKSAMGALPDDRKMMVKEKCLRGFLQPLPT